MKYESGKEDMMRERKWRGMNGCYATAIVTL